MNRSPLMNAQLMWDGMAISASPFDFGYCHLVESSGLRVLSATGFNR